VTWMRIAVPAILPSVRDQPMKLSCGRTAET
jgi:hypothetical protein